MTVEILTPIHQLLSGQLALPEHLRQNMLVLRFAMPTLPALSQLADFYRIQLTRELKQEAHGEREFYRADVYQPTRSGGRPRPCRDCSEIMSPATVQYWKCTNRKCQQFGRLVHCGPVRGVIDVKITEKCIHSRETVAWTTQGGQTRDINGLSLTTEVVRVKGCFLVLDRRYDEVVLAAVYRTAGAICDQYGWKLL